MHIQGLCRVKTIIIIIVKLVLSLELKCFGRMSIFNQIEQFHLPSCKDLNQLLKNLVNEAQAVLDQTMGNNFLTLFCEALSCSSELELLVCMLVGVRSHKV